MDSSSNLRRLAFLRYFAALVVLAGLAGCGGGGGGGGGADFSLSVTPSQVSLTAGSSVSVSLLTTPSGGFTSSVTVQPTNLPTGITVSPASVTLQPGTSQKVQVNAALSLGTGSVTVTFTGAAGGLSHGASLNVSLTAGLSLSRTKYVRTDAVTEYFSFINRHWSVYSPLTNRLFVSDPSGNHVMVLDVGTRTRLATLDVPGAFGMDDTPDHKTIYVGTLIGDVYTIDPVAMTVTGRFLASQIGSLGFQGSIALVLADGRLALLGAAGGIPNVDGSEEFLVWNPVDNSSTLYKTPFTASFGGSPATIVCGPLENIAGFTRSADRKKLFLGSADSDDTFCQVDAATGAFNYTAVGTFPAKIAVSPDGKFIATEQFGSAGSVVVLDANALTLVTQFPVPNADTASDSWITFGADSITVFIFSPSIVTAYNVNTHQQTGWVPNLVLEPTSGGFGTGPFTGPSGVDVGNGLLAGPMEEGVGFLDVSVMQTGAIGTQFLNGYLGPAFGPVAGGTATSLSNPAGTVNSVFFGTQRASFTPNGNLLNITTPPGAPGPVDVAVLMNDGGAWMLPEGFSYGPTILEITPNASTAEGGSTGIIYGYGLGPASGSTIPPDLTITVGGQPATILGYIGNAYGLLSPPFLLEAVAFKIPPGTAGTKVAVTVSNNSGSTTANAAFSYLPSTQVFTAGSTALAQGIYDTLRDVYYFTDATQVRVFSKTQGKFLSPISISGSQRLWGIALSPDGSKLAISDAQANQIYLLNPDTPGTVQTFPLPGPFPPVPGVITNPGGVAVSNAGMIYYTLTNQGGTGFHGFFKLDTTSKKITDYNIIAPGFQADDDLLRTAISADGARVYFNNAGSVFTVDTATDTLAFAVDEPPCCSIDFMDLALSSNNTRFSATFFDYDADLNAESFVTLNDREVLNVGDFFGMKLSPDGTLLFQPSTLGIDVFDGRLGTFRGRIAMPFSFASTYDTLVADGKDNIVIGIVGSSANQIAVIDLSSVPEPSPLPYVTAGRKPPVDFVSRAPAGAVPRAAASAPKPASDRTLSLPSRPPLGNKVPHVTPSAAPTAFWTGSEPAVH